MAREVDDAALLLSRRCSVYLAQLSTPKHLDWLSGSATRNFTVGAHYWIQRALATHPWRVGDARLADVVYVNASWQYTVRAGEGTDRPCARRQA